MTMQNRKMGAVILALTVALLAGCGTAGKGSQGTAEAQSGTAHAVVSESGVAGTAGMQNGGNDDAQSAADSEAESAGVDGAQSASGPATESADAAENGAVGDGTLFPVKERGIEFVVSKEFQEKGVQVEQYNENPKGYKNVGIYYYSPTARKLLDEVINMDESERTPEVSDEYTQKIQDTTRCLMEVAIVENREYKKVMNKGGKPEDFTYFAPAEYFGTNDGYTYIVSIPDLDDGKLTAEEAADYHDCKKYMQTVKQNIRFLPVELESDETNVGSVMPAFTTTDLTGQEISSDIFTKKDLTVVNLWGTFCGPCIEEMPELAKLSEKYADTVQFLGIVGDIDGQKDTKHLELAKTITGKAGVTYPNLVVNDDLKDLLSGVIGYPTTIFVDRNGNIVGDPIVGSDVSLTEKRIQSQGQNVAQ